MKHYFLFGSGIIDAYNDGGMRAACKHARNYCDWSVFCFEDGVTTPFGLLDAYDRYLKWILIDEKEYKKFKTI